ncbi:hypothetical protein B0H14DRAFT_2633006 [Mycena olivaceomarginata]|nr:hypothetical protein B0H14DRAFT_2633006 [Mycena olivaceomarginata]
MARFLRRLAFSSRFLRRLLLHVLVPTWNRPEAKADGAKTWIVLRPESRTVANRNLLPPPDDFVSNYDNLLSEMAGMKTTHSRIGGAAVVDESNRVAGAVSWVARQDSRELVYDRLLRQLLFGNNGELTGSDASNGHRANRYRRPACKQSGICADKPRITGLATIETD